MTQNAVRLADCPPGLFMFGTTLGFRSEYATVTESNPNQPDAYVVDSGEYFWGGCTTSLDRSDLMVAPLSAPVLLELAAEAMYERGRLKVGGRPRWDKLNPKEPYDMGMKQAAREMAIALSSPVVSLSETGELHSNEGTR